MIRMLEDRNGSRAGVGHPEHRHRHPATDMRIGEFGLKIGRSGGHRRRGRLDHRNGRHITHQLGGAAPHPTLRAGFLRVLDLPPGMLGVGAQHHRLLPHQNERDHRIVRAGTGAAFRIHIGADLRQLRRQRHDRRDGRGRRLSLHRRRLGLHRRLATGWVSTGWVVGASVGGGAANVCAWEVSSADWADSVSCMLLYRSSWQPKSSRPHSGLRFLWA